MEKKNLIEPPEPSLETAPSTEADLSLSTTEDQQIATLKELMQSVQAMKAQSIRDAMFKDAIADFKAVAKSLLAATPEKAAVNPSSSKRDCSDESGNCGCIKDDCCCFEIVFEKMRATAHQIEIPDGGSIPLAANAMEIQVFVEANGSGILFPSMSSYVDLHIENIMLGTGPGPWVKVNQPINRVYVKKGTTVRCRYSCQVRESDARLTEQVALAGQDEFGEADGWLDLNCCMPIIYPDITTEVSLNYIGNGGSRVQIVVLARRVCC